MNPVECAEKGEKEGWFAYNPIPVVDEFAQPR